MIMRFAAVLGAFALALVPAVSDAATTLTILAPPISQSSLDAIIKNYQKAHPDVAVTAQYAPSVTSLEMVKKNQPVDLIIVPDTLVDKNAPLFSGSALAFQNHTIVVVAKKSESKIHTPKDLGNKGVRVGAGTSGSVVEAYQDQTLRNLARTYGADFPEKYKANTVTTAALSTKFYPQMDEGVIDAAIALSSEVTPSDTKYVVVALPADTTVTNRYMVNVVKNGAHVDAAKEFMAYVSGSDVQAIWRSNHFDPK
ncbi:MAG TPA: extracellular solute-binding protein [Candidatus Sulfotelmatobacter sp.]|nr:extracellular solute-binding protein [Candidatus Sulfotelmatobacter sp.]